MPAVIDARAERSCWATDYWLLRCVGYRVIAGDESIGYVVDVLEGDDGRPTALVVRIGEFFTHLLEIPLEAIDGFDPARERVLIAPLVPTEEVKAYQLLIPAVA